MAWIVVASALVACGPSTSDDADLAELCSQRGPVQVLPLEADEIVAPIYGAAATHEDRFLYGVRTMSGPVGAWLDGGGHAWSPPYEEEVAARVESVDRCGGDRRVVAEGFAEIWPPEDPGGPWLGYATGTGELFTFDPRGDAPARRLARTPNRPVRLVAGTDVFVQRSDAHDFARITITPDALQTQVLLTEVDSFTFPFDDPQFVVVVREDASLWEVDLQSGRAEALATEGRPVRWASMFREPRWVVWLPLEPEAVAEGPGAATGLPTEVWTLDRETGVSRLLAQDAGGLGVWAQQDIVVILDSDSDLGPVQELVTYDGTARLMLDADAGYFADDGQGHHVVFEKGMTQTGIYEVRDGAIERIGTAGPGTRLSEGALWRVEPYVDGHGLDAFEIVRTPLATREREVFRRDVYSDVELADGRWARFDGEVPTTPIDLVVIDPTTGRTQLVDERVVPSLVEYGTRQPEGTWLAEELVYQVVDDTGSRAGLWRARFTD